MLHRPNQVSVPVSPKSRSVWTIAACILSLAVAASASAQQSNDVQATTSVSTVDPQTAARAQAASVPADENAQLLFLAEELKKDMEKTSKDMLSVDVIRKAQDIEHLARDAEYKTRLTLAAR